MRNKPRIRFKGFTEDWEERKLGDLAEIVRGASPRPISDPKWFDNDSSVGWLRIADVTAQDGRIRYLEQKISELGQEKTRVIKTPHLLLSIAATVGKPVINYIPTGVHDGFLIFLNPKFNILYTFWWLEMFREKWNKYGQPGSQVNLNSDLVKNQVINIPNEKEQEKISSFLESLDKIITLHQRKLEKLKLVKKALLQKLFPKNGSQFPEIRFKGFIDAWEQYKLEDICLYQSSSVTINDVDENGRYDLYDVNSLIGKTNKGFMEKEYITIIKDGAGVGRTRILPKNSMFLGTMGALTPKNSNLEFLYQLVTSANLGKICSGSTIPHIYFKDYGKLKFYIPSIIEQEVIGKIFYNIDNLITLHQCKLDKLQDVKKGLLQKMFV